jgi:hypothetical protein
LCKILINNVLTYYGRTLISFSFYNVTGAGSYICFTKPNGDKCCYNIPTGTNVTLCLDGVTNLHTPCTAPGQPCTCSSLSLVDFESGIIVDIYSGTGIHDQYAVHWVPGTSHWVYEWQFGGSTYTGPNGLPIPDLILEPVDGDNTQLGVSWGYPDALDQDGRAMHWCC